MDNKVEVQTADFAIGHAPQILLTRGVGSCVVVCLYEKQKKMGALCHIMLPHSPDEHLNPLRFADTALAIIFEELAKKGIKKKELVAKIIGGANMFVGIMNDLGAKNVEAVVNIMHESGIPIVMREVGGSHGRSLEFDLETGIVKIFTKG